MNKICLFLACVFACLMVATTATAGPPSPFKDPYATQPPVANTPPANPPPAQPGVTTTPTPTKPPGGGGGTNRNTVPPPSGGLDCPFGQTEATEKVPSRCVTVQEWIATEREGEQIKGAKNARLWGWIITCAIGAIAVAFCSWFYLSVRKKMNLQNGVILKMYKTLEADREAAAKAAPKKA